MKAPQQAITIIITWNLNGYKNEYRETNCSNNHRSISSPRAAAPFKCNRLMEKQEKELRRKGGNAKGVRTQKMISFRLDNENEEWLQQQQNKGRYINELIKKDKEEKL